MKKVACLLLCGLLGSASAASFAQTDYTLSYGFDTSHAKTLNIFYKQGSGSNHLDVYAGPFSASFVGAQPAGYAYLHNNFSVYCVDLDHYDTSPSTVNVRPFDTSSTPPGTPPVQTWVGLEHAAWLYANFSAEVGTGATTNWMAAAGLQVAIWDVIQQDRYVTGGFDRLNNTLLDVSASNSYFYITADSFAPGGTLRTSTADFASIVGDANRYLNALYNAHPNTAPGTLFQIDRSKMGSNGQDMLGPAATPEGSSLLLFALGGLPVLGAVLKRRRGAAAAA